MVCKQETADRICNELEKIINEEEIEINPYWFELLELLKRGFSEIGFELYYYMKTQEDLIVFTQLIRRVLDKIVPEYAEETQEMLEGFYQHLLEAQETFYTLKFGRDYKVDKNKKTIH